MVPRILDQEPEHVHADVEDGVDGIDAGDSVCVGVRRGTWRWCSRIDSRVGKVGYDLAVHRHRIPVVRNDHIDAEHRLAGYFTEGAFNVNAEQLMLPVILVEVGVDVGRTQCDQAARVEAVEDPRESIRMPFILDLDQYCIRCHADRDDRRLCFYLVMI